MQAGKELMCAFTYTQTQCDISLVSLGNQSISTSGLYMDLELQAVAIKRWILKPWCMHQ